MIAMALQLDEKHKVDKMYWKEFVSGLGGAISLGLQ